MLPSRILKTDTGAALLTLALVVVASAPGHALEPQADDPSSTFPAEVDLVVIDVAVLDDDRNAVSGLTVEDFTLKEEGRQQAITSFEAIEIPETPATEWRELRPPLNLSTNDTPERHRATGRSFVTVFDDVHLTPQDAVFARDAISEFFDTGVRDGDMVTLISAGGGVWWSTRAGESRKELHELVAGLAGRFVPDISRDWISDYEAMRIHHYGDHQIARRVERRYIKFGVLDQDEQFEITEQRSIGMNDPLVTARASEYYRSAMARAEITLRTLKRAIQAQTLTRGRKSLILVSDGFVYDTFTPQFEEVSRAALRSNVVVYFVNARGLSGMPTQHGAQFQRLAEVMPDEQDMGLAVFADQYEAQGAEEIASESGGFTIKNSNDLAGGLLRVEKESRSYYLLGYLPTDTTRDGAFRKVEVDVRGRGLDVRARKGYYAPGAAEPRPEPERDADVQVALDSPFDLPGIPLRMAAYVFEETLLGQARAVVAADIDIRELEFREEEGRAVKTLEYLLAVVDRGSGEPYRYDEKVDMRLRPTTRASYEASWYPIRREFELGPGTYRAKIVVRDTDTGVLGTVMHDFEVPEMDGLRLSTPILTEFLKRGAGGPRDLNAEPSARRTFWAGELLYCQFDVFGAPFDPGTGMPQVSGGHSVLDAQGQALFAVEPTPIRPSSLGALRRLVGFSTEGLAPGDYVLRLELRDSLSGRAVSVDQGFRLRDPAAPAEGD